MGQCDILAEDDHLILVSHGDMTSIISRQGILSTNWPSATDYYWELEKMKWKGMEEIAN